MDTSETYVKMCGKAEEIQALRREEKHHDTGKWLNGDFYGSVLDARVFVVSRGNDAWADEPYYIHHPSEAIWLPRQDQLQEMVAGNSAQELVASFAEFVNPSIVYEPYDILEDNWVCRRLTNTVEFEYPEKFNVTNQPWLALV